MQYEVPGFSTFIVPFGPDHVVTVGQYFPEEGPFFSPAAVQLSIFDVTDFQNPVQSHNLIIGDETGSYSEALFDPKAFTLFAEQGRIALPISINGGFFFPDIGVVTGVVEPDSEDPPTTEPVEATDAISADIEEIVDDGFNGLLIFDVSTESGFAEVSRLSTRFGAFQFAGFTRGVFIGDSVFAVTNLGLRGIPVTAPDTAPVEVRFEPQ